MNSVRPGQQAGHWLTLLHGFSQNARLFERQKEYFERHYRVFCPELLGHGARDIPTTDYSLQSHARDVLEQMRAHGIERTHFWGTHTGTSVGLLLALEQPDLIASLVLEAVVVPGLDMPIVTATIERARSVARTSGVRAAMEDWFQHAGWFRAMRQNFDTFRADAQRDLVCTFQGQPLLAEPRLPALSLVERVQALTCPVLLYNGSDDMDDFKRTAIWLAQNLPHAEREELPGLGGFPLWEAPEHVNVRVERFLSGLTTS